MSNKRKNDRVDMKIKSEVHATDAMTYSSTVNLSSGGLFISTPEPLSNGTELLLALQLPGGETVEIKGKVKWVRQNEVEDERAGMGIEFVDLKEEDAAKLKNLL